MEDKKAIYKREMANYIDKIKVIANENKIPFFFAAATGMNNNGRYHIESDCMLPEMFGYDLNPKDTRFEDFCNILSKDFTTRPITGNDAISIEDLAIPTDFGNSDID